MVGSKILSQVNNRLKAIMDNSLDFGGVSISVGDIHQLRTVKDSYVFQIPISSANNYDGLVGPYLWEKFSFIELLYDSFTTMTDLLPPLLVPWIFFIYDRFTTLHNIITEEEE